MDSATTPADTMAVRRPAASAALAAALEPDAAARLPATFSLAARDEAGRATLAQRLAADLAPLAPSLRPLSGLDRGILLLAFPGRGFARPEAAFAAAQALVEEYGLAVAEPDLPTAFFPETDPPDDRFRREGLDNFPPGCWAPEQPELRNDPRWALRQLRAPEAWSLSQETGRPSGGQDVLVAQIDTGLAAHAELEGLVRVPGHDFVDDDADSTDPLDYSGNPGHGTGTGSVVAAPGHRTLCGSAPLARLMPVRAIESVIRLSQVPVAEAVDFAVAQGAQVITMSLGGLPSISLGRAVSRAVASDVVVVAAAGNCVGEVVFPARYGACIAVAGTDWQDRPWRGSSRGGAVAIAAPAENVYRARVSAPGAPGTEFGQGQGTSFAVALVAGVAALWLAHHGRAEVIAAARAGGETVQDLFRRLLRATARRPDGWDGLDMGAGVVDAAALLGADLRLGRDRREAPALSAQPGVAGAAAVRSLLVGVYGEEGDPPGLDWSRHGAELAYHALRSRLRRARGPQAEAPMAPAELSTPLRRALADKALLARLVTPPPEANLPPPGAPASAAAPEGVRQESARSSGTFGSLLLRTRKTAGLRSESVALGEPAHADDVLADVKATLERMPTDEVTDPEAFRRALTTLLEQGEAPLRRLVAEPHKPPPRGDRMALEALIIADGSRPSFTLKDGRVNLSHPFAEPWRSELQAEPELLRRRALAVGSVDSSDPAKGAMPFFGTCWLADGQQGWAITNLHVLTMLRSWLPHLFLPAAAGSFRVRPGVFVDFTREKGQLDRASVPVVEAVAPGPQGPGFATLDLALLRLDFAGAAMPEPIPVSLSLDAAMGDRPSLCTVGHPAEPDTETRSDGRVDWSWVLRQIFGNTFNVKRLAPGRSRRKLGEAGDDPRKWVFGHDATTFGGASGSPVFDWLATDAAAVGLHFAGTTLDTNVAHALGQCREYLEKCGIPVRAEN